MCKVTFYLEVTEDTQLDTDELFEVVNKALQNKAECTKIKVIYTKKKKAQPYLTHEDIKNYPNPDVGGEH